MANLQVEFNTGWKKTIIKIKLSTFYHMISIENVLSFPEYAKT